jgi:hypothetical protein
MKSTFGIRIIAPLQGLIIYGCLRTQGVALGYVIMPLLGRKYIKILSVG